RSGILLPLGKLLHQRPLLLRRQVTKDLELFRRGRLREGRCRQDQRQSGQKEFAPWKRQGSLHVSDYTDNRLGGWRARIDYFHAPSPADATIGSLPDQPDQSGLRTCR